MDKSQKKNGYSVIELSIVLIIIGIISATFLGAATLFKNSQIVSVAVQFEDFRAATLGFNLQYGGHPGDFSDASDFWPNNNTADGNGNGIIELDDGADDEGLLAWQHLSLSAFIQGSFSGFYNGGYRNVANDISLPNIPLVADERASFFIGEIAAVPLINGGTRTANALVYSRFNRDDSFTQASLSRGDAQMVDEKIDDGRALEGNLIAVDDAVAAGGDCVDDTERSQYVLSPDDDTVYCALVFWIDN